MAMIATLLQLLSLLGFAWWLLAHYKDARVSPSVHAAVFLSWSLGFLALVLLPVDLVENGLAAPNELAVASNMDAGDAGANSSASSNTTLALLTASVETHGEGYVHYIWAWQALYWLTFLLSWLVLPFLTELCQNGEFLLDRRIVSSIKRLVLHWTILSATCGVVVIYLVCVGHLSLFGLVGLAMASANTYGLLWLIALLGFGLVDVPRSFWRLRGPANRLKELHFRAVQVHEERMEAKFELEDAAEAVNTCYERMLHAEGIAIILTSDMQFVKACLQQVKALVDSQDSDGASVFIIWGELTMGLSSDAMSLFRAFSREWEANASELLAFAVLLYMAACAYSSLCKLRGFGRFVLCRHHSSTDLCLLKTAMFQCRLQFAVGYNFLLLLDDRSMTDRTAFATLFENMRVVHVFGRGFSVYAPILMVLLGTFALGDGYARVMKRLGVEQYEQVMLGSADHEAAIVKGYALVQQGLERYRTIIRRRKNAGASSGGASGYQFYGFARDGAQALLGDDDDEHSEDDSRIVERHIQARELRSSLE
ncbi:hypothetical protein PybrP1_008356 [[Pythium] brassicae (nom. inval.)]|nr:hypothetical protein PybrP1_008356 [[Pythium] brassicae (nom. inval.)]